MKLLLIGWVLEAVAHWLTLATWLLKHELGYTTGAGYMGRNYGQRIAGGHMGRFSVCLFNFPSSSPLDSFQPILGSEVGTLQYLTPRNSVWDILLKIEPVVPGLVFIKQTFMIVSSG